MFKIIGADQKQYGPVSVEGLRQWVAEGRANGATLVQAEGTTEWKPMASVPEFAGLFPGAAAGGVSTGAPVSPPPGPMTGAPMTGGPITRPNIPTYLPHAIVVTLCCCLPLGIPAIVYAAQVSSKLSVGDLDGAQVASDKAKMWFWIALGTGLVLNLAYLALVLSGAVKMPH